MGHLTLDISGETSSTFPSNTEVNPNEHVKSITTGSEVLLPKIQVKRPIAHIENVSSTNEEHIE